MPHLGLRARCGGQGIVNVGPLGYLHVGTRRSRCEAERAPEARGRGGEIARFIEQCGEAMGSAMSMKPKPTHQQAEKMLLVQLTKHDAHAHPIPHNNSILSVLNITSKQPSSYSTTKGKKSKKKSKKQKLSTQSVPLDFLPEDKLFTARTLLDNATHNILHEQRLLLHNSLTDPTITKQELDDALAAQKLIFSSTGAAVTSINTHPPTEISNLTPVTSLLTK
mmetsp:Transcript_31562/g.36462  ORF Transcript_31562/g.36462 Transcript_31562/m.36462 type:complete len:222 (+) Transcript_31562:145-810(+)